MTSIAPTIDTPNRQPVITISGSKVVFHDPRKAGPPPLPLQVAPSAAVVELMLSPRAAARLALYAQRFTEGDVSGGGKARHCGCDRSVLDG